MKYQPKDTKPKKVEHHKSLATPKPRKSRLLLRWSPTGKLFDKEGKMVDSRESKSQFDCSNGDNAYTSNSLEPKIKRFSNSTSLLDRKKQKSISSTKTCSKFEAEITSSSYGFVWTNENCQYKWKVVRLVIVDDYSRYTWVHFLISKDETPEVIIKFLKRITVLLQSPVIIIRTDNGTEFKNQMLKEFFDIVGISHQMSSVRTPQQNRVVERRNLTLVEAARTMLIFSRAPLFLWAEAIATTIRRWCYNLTPAESKFKTLMLDHQDKYMMKAQDKGARFVWGSVRSGRGKWWVVVEWSREYGKWSCRCGGKIRGVNSGLNRGLGTGVVFV
nr:putative ribonuclease H-like domain-containing protein [Tanacetum cinerariifolium]